MGFVSNSKKEGSRRGGRPRGFDRDAALGQAMQLFWRHGYEGVSIADLTAAMGIAPPSLYAAFGSKAGLFSEVLDHYARTSGTIEAPALREAGTLEAWVRALLEATIASVAGSGRACLVSSGLVQCHPDHEAVAAAVAERRTGFRLAIQAGLERWLPGPDADAAARFLASVLQGVSVQVRDGARRADLDAVAEYAVTAVLARPIRRGA